MSHNLNCENYEKNILHISRPIPSNDFGKKILGKVTKEKQIR